MNITRAEACQKVLERIELQDWFKLNSKYKKLPRRKTLVTINPDGTKKFLHARGNPLISQMRRWASQENQLNVEVAMQPGGQPARLRLTYKLGIIQELEIPQTAKKEIVIDGKTHAFIGYRDGLQVIMHGALHLNQEQMREVLKNGRLLIGTGMQEGPRVNFRVAAKYLGQIVHYNKTGFTDRTTAFLI